MVGARASIAVIQTEGAQLQLCQCCQLILERQKHPFGSVASRNKVTLPSSSDRANKICRFMDNFNNNVEVQVVGLDALLFFTHNADAPIAVRSTDMLEVVVKGLRTHKLTPAVVWRACSVMGMVASFSSEMAVKIAVTHIHEELVEVYNTYTSIPIVQLHILRLYGHLLSHTKSYVLLHKSKVCVEFLRDIVEGMGKAREREEETKRELERQKLASKGVRGIFPRLFLRLPYQRAVSKI
ncbi:hypothetical protein EON63_06005 [archaeon]|nr:MAG: hypothetical protein EON63_06005 [archaeon]